MTTAGLEARAGGEDASAFIVDMNDVFERFVCTALREQLRLDAKAFPTENRGHTVYLDTGRFVLLKPDLSWWVAGRCVFAGDCKYKRTVGTIPNADIYQMLAYLTALQLPEGLLIYAAGEDTPAELIIEQASKRLHVRTLDVSRPPTQLMHDVRSLAQSVRDMATTVSTAAVP